MSRIVQTASVLAGVGGGTITWATPRAGNVIVEVVCKRNGGPGAVNVNAQYDNAVGAAMSFTSFVGVIEIRSGDVAGGDGMTIAYRVSAGNETQIYWGVQNQHIVIYELEGIADPGSSSWVGRSATAIPGALKALGGFDLVPGAIEIAGYGVDTGAVDQTAGGGWTQDYQAVNGAGHPLMLAMHAVPGTYAQITGSTNEWMGQAIMLPPSVGTGLGGVTGPSLLIEYFDNDPATFGPTLLQGVILDAIKIGWSWYSRYPSNAFFTLRANSAHNLRLLPLQTHIRITYYNPRTGYSAVVFTGRLSEPDHSGEDVVWTAWNYLSELSLSRSGYRTLYPGKLLGTEIAAVEWAAARTATYALLNFVTTGTIENPLGTDEVTAIVTDNRFGVIDVPRLLLMFDLTEIGRANTVHNVTMGITRTSPFSFFFLKNAGAAITGKRLVFPGNVRDFRYVPGYAAIRNDLATIGTAADGSAVEIVKTDEVNALAYGRRQDVFTIKTLQGQVGGATESDAQNAITARAVKEATTLGQSVLLDVRPELVEPFDGWDIEDTIKVEVYRGRVAINDTFRIIGCRGLQDESGYHPQIYIQLPTQA